MTSAPTTTRTGPRWSPALGGAVLCWGGAALLVHRTAEIAVVDGVRAQLGSGDPETSFGALAALAGGAVLLAIGYAVLLVTGARPRAGATSGGSLVAGGGLLAIGVLALALAWQHGTARGAIAEWAGHPPPVTGHGEGVLVLVSLTTLLLGGALLVHAVVRAVVRARSRTT